MSVTLQLCLSLALFGLWIACACCRRFLRDLAEDIGDYLLPADGAARDGNNDVVSIVPMPRRAIKYDVKPLASSAPTLPPHHLGADPTDRQWSGRS